MRVRRGSKHHDRDLGSPEAVARFHGGDPETVDSVRRLILDVLRTHSSELKPYWDDLVMEVCTQAWQRVRRDGDAVRNLEGLVARMTHARVIDLHRHRSRWRWERDPEERLASMTDPDPGPYETLRREETSHLARALIADQDERTRTIWRLLYFEGLKYREAALQLGMPEGTLKRLVYESLRAAAARWRATQSPGAPAADPQPEET